MNTRFEIREDKGYTKGAIKNLHPALVKSVSILAKYSTLKTFGKSIENFLSLNNPSLNNNYSPNKNIAVTQLALNSPLLKPNLLINLHRNEIPTSHL